VTMRADKIIYWCDACDCEHTLDADNMPCPVEYGRIERRCELLQEQVDALDETADLLRATIKALDLKIKRLESKTAVPYAPATPMA